MNLTPELVISAVYLLWFLVLSFFILRVYLGYLRVLKSGKKESLIALIDEVLRKEVENRKILDQLIASYDKLKVDGTSHIQKIGLVRFNPFKETGGDQSFILALVDADDTGVVISSLHTRTGTRWYAKNIIKGEGAEYDLSDDEKKALKGAQFLSRISNK